jgi:hypothetical protein
MPSFLFACNTSACAPPLRPVVYVPMWCMHHLDIVLLMVRVERYRILQN